MDGQRGREPWYSKLSRIANSTICFSLAYVVFTYLFWYMMGRAGKLFRFDSFVYYYGVKFLLNDGAWTRMKVTFVYSSGPFFCLGLGLLCLYLFQRLKRIDFILNLIFIWGFVIGTAIFASQGIIASLGIGESTSPFYQNFAVVFAWWHFPPVLVYLLAVPFILILLFFAVSYPRHFLLTAYSYSKVYKESKRKKFFIETAIIPFIFGAVITTAITFPMNIFIHAIYIFTIGSALILSWVALIYIEIFKDDLLRYTSLQTPSVFVFFLFFIAAFLVYIGWNGINLSSI